MKILTNYKFFLLKFSNIILYNFYFYKIFNNININQILCQIYVYIKLNLPDVETNTALEYFTNELG